MIDQPLILDTTTSQTSFSIQPMNTKIGEWPQLIGTIMTLFLQTATSTALHITHQIIPTIPLTILTPTSKTQIINLTTPMFTLVCIQPTIKTTDGMTYIAPPTEI